MTLSRTKWVVTAGIAAAAIIALTAMISYVHQLTTTTMPKIPTPDQVANMSAEMSGTLLRLPVTDRFEVPKEFYAEVCHHFSGQSRKWDVYDPKTMYKSKLGDVHFDLQAGGHFDLSFYTAGKGVIGYSVGRDYYVADTGVNDGGASLSFVLDAARRAVGVKPKD